jgi:Arabinose-binding domain of AraC transcription regulator, N-term
MSREPRCKIPIGLVAALREAGVSAEHVLASARLPSRLLDTPGRYVPASDYFALWNSIRALSGDPAIGIRLATLVKPELTEPLFLAVLSAGNLAEAIAVVSRFKRLLEPEDLVVVEDAAAEQLVVTYSWPDGEEQVPQSLVDAELAFLVEIGRRGTGWPDLSPQQIFLRASALEAGGGHRDYFRCAIRLGARRNAIAFAAADSGRPFATRNPELLNALLPHLQANTPAPPDAGIARVRSVIAERVRGRRPEVDEVAKELAMSLRAMQRLFVR